MMGQEEEKGTVRCDLTGNIYSETVFASILSMFYFRRLMSDERFPDTLNGVTVTPKIVQTENFNFRNVPTDINTPSIRLYPLLESMSGRVDLKMPGITFTSYTDKYVMPASNSLLMLPINKMNQRLPEAYKTEWLPAVLDYYF